MTGGKSAQSSDTTSTTQTTSATATGTVGQVLQGQDIIINQNLPDGVIAVFKELTGLTGKAIDTAASAGQKALESTNSLAQATKQPDLTLIQGYQKQVYYAIGAAAIITLLILFKK